MYLSFPGDPDSGKKGIERTMKRRLDTLIPIGDTNLHKTYARDVEWTQRIINGPDNPEEQPQIPVQTETTEIEQDTPNNEQQEEETQEPTPNGDKDYAEDDPSQEHPAGQTQEPVQKENTQNDQDNPNNEQREEQTHEAVQQGNKEPDQDNTNDARQGE